MKRLEGKIAIITGGASGMGEAHVRLFIEEGAKVVITDIVEDAGIKLAKEVGENAIFLKHDVANSNSWAEVVKSVINKFGTIDILVNNAGYAGPIALLADLKDEDYLGVISVDQHGTFYGMKAVIPEMIKNGGGSIINIGSVAAFRFEDGTNNAAYSTAKFAIRGLTQAAAYQYGDKNIRVNAVHPGGVSTPLLEAHFDKAQLAELASGHPLQKRLGKPREISQVVLFLASDDSSFVTGADYVIDGGKSIH